MLPGGHCLTLNDAGIMLHSKMPMPYPGTCGYGDGIFLKIAVDYYVTVDISCTCNFNNPKRKKVINQ